MLVRKTVLVLSVAAALAWCCPPASAQKVTPDYALKVARNWVKLIVHEKGGWGDSPTAEAGAIREFKRGNRLIGYFCPVKPNGFIVVSIDKALAPVKAYSETSNIDPSSDKGLADLIKGGMERVINGVERRVGKIEKAGPARVRKALEIDYTSAWTELAAAAPGPVAANYTQGEFMLTSLWHQHDPYNRDCPSGPTCDHCEAGCTAIATAQILRHWCWPPYGVNSPYSDSYDWPNMRDQVYSYSPQEQIDAVAELCYEPGVAMNQTYGCTESGASIDNVEAPLENEFRYSTACVRRDRIDYTAEEWFDRLKQQFNANRPGTLPHSRAQHRRRRVAGHRDFADHPAIPFQLRLDRHVVHYVVHPRRAARRRSQRGVHARKHRSSRRSRRRDLRHVSQRELPLPLLRP